MGRLHALLLHGAGGGAWEWNRWREVFDAWGVAAHAIDLQPAAAGLAATRLDDYRAQAHAALRALPRPRVAIGASLGGLLATACADEADAVALVNPIPPAPWVHALPPREWPDVVPWRREARLAATRRALPDADDATALFAFRHWRDESGAVLREASAGVAMERPRCPVLCVVSDADEDVPPAIGARFANDWRAGFIRVPGSHVGPLLGRDAHRCAQLALDWLHLRLP